MQTLVGYVLQSIILNHFLTYSSQTYRWFPIIKRDRCPSGNWTLHNPFGETVFEMKSLFWKTVVSPDDILVS